MKIVRTLETYREYVDYAKNTPRSQRSVNRGDRHSETGSESFTGTESFDEAISTAIEGWDYGLKELALQDGLAVNGGVDFTSNVHGSIVNIGNYVMGLPDNMYELTEKREYNLEELTIYVPLAYNCGVTTDRALKFCNSIINLLNSYQQNHNVRIIGFFDVNLWDHDVKMVNEVIIKDFDTRFVINNIAFAFHPSFFRRLWFKKLETTEYTQYGYGRSTQDKEIEKRISTEVKEALNKHKTILVPQLESLAYGEFSEEKTKKYNFK